MKKFNKKVMSLATVAAILASFASVSPASAASDSYSLSYETLTAPVITESGDVIPASTIAVTMSIDRNSGFNSDNLALNINNHYSVLTNSEGKPIVQTGEVLEGFLTSSAVTNNKICVAVASVKKTYENGELFTVYLTSSDTEPTFYRMSESIATITTATQYNVRSTGNVVGDVDYDGRINVIDAATLMGACAQNQIGDENSTNIMPILYAYLKRDYTINEGAITVNKYGLSFVEGNETKPVDPRCLNCINESYCEIAPNKVDTRMINDNDSSEILSYSAIVGSGGTYSGMVGMNINNVETLNATAEVVHERATTATRSVIYRYNMNVDIFNTMTVDGYNTFWLPALISKHNYDKKVDLYPAQVFDDVCTRFSSLNANTDPDVWVTSTLLLLNSFPIVQDQMDYIDVYDAINGDTPFYCQFRKETNSKAVLICGFTLYSDGTATYRIMDPEYTSFRTTAVSQTEMLNGSTLTYPSTGYTWRRGYYIAS